MRWLALAVLGACSFTPGAAGSGGGSNDAQVADVSDIDGLVVLDPDAPTDAPRPGKLRSIDITDAKVIGGPHVDFPLLVKISAQPWLRSVANGGDVLRDDGFDLYFSADPAGLTRLAFEVEAYTPATGDLIAWVKVPAFAATTVLYLNYGDPAITTNQAMPTSVWTSGYELVLHFNGTGDATGKAASVPGSNLTQAAGIGPARSFDGFSSYSNPGSGTALDDIFAGGGSLEGWFNAASYGEGGYGRLFDKGGNGYALFVDNSNASNSMSFYHYTPTGFGQWHFGTGTTSVNAWHHAVLLFNTDAVANDPSIYIDGNLVTPTEDTAPTGSYDDDSASDLIVGSNANQSRTFDGVLEELRASSVIRSDGWIKTQFSNHADPATFYTISSPL